MVAAADAGQIDLYEDCGWRVGQEHVTTLAAIAASGTYDGVTWSVGESQPQQTITLILMHRGLYQLTTPVLDTQGKPHTTCSFVVGVKGGLSNEGYINSTTGSSSFNGSARRFWCNGGFRGSLPESLRSAFKSYTSECSVYSSGSSKGSMTSYTTYFALPAYTEIYGATTSVFAPPTSEYSALTQFSIFETSSNVTSILNNAWTSSHYATAFGKWILVGNSGWSYLNMTGLLKIAPIGCM